MARRDARLPRALTVSTHVVGQEEPVAEWAGAWRDNPADDSMLATTTQTPAYAEERDERNWSVTRAAVSLLRNHGRRSFLAPALISPEGILAVAAAAVVDPPGRRLRCCRRPLRAEIIWLLGHVAPHRLM